jgi:hypothetical protein
LEEAVVTAEAVMEEVVAVDLAGVVAEAAEEGEEMVVVEVDVEVEVDLEEAVGPEVECLETPAIREAEDWQILWLAADSQMTLAQSPESQGQSFQCFEFALCLCKCECTHTLTM